MKRKVIICIISILMMILLASCSIGLAASTEISMEMTSSYDVADPFVNAKLFYVSDNAGSVDFEVSFQMNCGSALLEIADNETNEVIFSKNWTESADNTDDTFSFTLSGLSKEKEYVIRLTCTEVEVVKLVIRSDSSLVRELEKPSKPTAEGDEH